MRKLLQSLFVLLFFAVTAFAQERTITGTVTSKDDGKPIPGVSVKLKSHNGGAVTDGNGRFSVTGTPKSILQFSSIGFQPMEIIVGNQAAINVSLNSDSQSLQEVTIQVPYGTMKKSSFTGSESTVSSATLAKQQVTSFTRALEGLVPGLVATNGGGQPGSNASVLIRGVGSVNASSAPLYVLDGAPYNGSISSLSMDDIESVTVLKDASAAALYGSRGANGVIMIKTKQGRQGKPAVNVSLRNGWTSRGIPEYDRVNSGQYYELMWEATKNRLMNGSTKQTPEQAGINASTVLTGPNGLVYNAYDVPGNQLVDPVTGKLNPNAKLLWNDDWSKVLFRTGKRRDFNFNVSGASDKSDYFISLGYVKEDGITKFTDYERYTARVNVNSQVRDWLKAGINMDGAISDQRYNVATGTATTNPFYYSRMMGPIYPVYQRTATGDYVVDPVTGKNSLDWGNASQMGLRPYAPNSNLLGSLELDERGGKPTNINANTYLEASFLSDFKFRTTLAATYYDGYTTTFQNSLYGDAQNVSGRSTKENDRELTYTLNEVLSYHKSIGNHNINALVGHENYFFRQNFVSATRTGFPFPGTNELAPAATSEASTSYENNHRIEGYFANVNYQYNSKYLASASYRRDGTSRFYKDSQWGDFYSFGLGWRLSQENFLKGATWIDELKLKGSYGQQGNENLGTNYYAWQSLYSLGWNNVNFPGATIGTLPNLDLRWEKNTNSNIGVDFGFFNNRVQGTVEVYNKVSDNLLFDVPLPTSTGITSITKNIGTMSNKGIDLALAVTPVRTSKFDWRIDINLTRFKNKITKLPQPEIIVGTKKLMVGKSLYDFWIKDYAGVDPANGDALFYKDVLGTDGKPTGERTTTNNISLGSFYYKGSALPDLSGGITNSFRYGNVDLSFLFTFQSGGKFYDGNYASLMHVGSYGTAWSTDILNRWTTPGQVTDVPRIQNALANQSGTSSRFLYDASYLNFKNISLGYNMPKKWANSIGITGGKLFGTIDNGYLWTKGHKGMDPQRSITGVSDYTYPIYRTFTVGLNVNL
jgi:TonB-linked SusC/RagA family outer membrane protein